MVLSCPLWPTLRRVVAQHSTLITLVREALQDVEGVATAFVYGSQATGTADAESDIDVFILGDAVDVRSMHHAFAEVSVLTDVPVGRRSTRPHGSPSSSAGPMPPGSDSSVPSSPARRSGLRGPWRP